MTNSFSLKWGGGIVEIVDEILSNCPEATGLMVNWQTFGSNGHETADYSRGVLERFTRRAPVNWYTLIKNGTFPIGNFYWKSVLNPRLVYVFDNAHSAVYFNNRNCVNSNGISKDVIMKSPPTVAADKIVVNHYNTKSREEYLQKIARGGADHNVEYTNLFDALNRNEEFDDGILRYAFERAKNFRYPEARADDILFNALTVNLSQTFLSNMPKDFYRGKLELFLTCRAVASYLNEKFGDKIPAKFFEEAAVNAILKCLISGLEFDEIQFFFRELPILLKLSYPATKEFRKAGMQILEHMQAGMREHTMWKEYCDLADMREFLKQ